jgi:hypothetical protein
MPITSPLSTITLQHLVLECTSSLNLFIPTRETYSRNSASKHTILGNSVHLHFPNRHLRLGPTVRELPLDHMQYHPVLQSPESGI